MKRILILEDDQQIAEFETDYLEASQYEVDVCGEGHAGLQLARENPYDLIVLDIMLPGLDGFEICRQLAREKNIPILFVTAKADNIDVLRGLNLGAADYITKPFEPSEFVARVNMHISRYERLTHPQLQDADTLVVEELRIERRSRRVFCREREVPLTNKEFDLLLFMAENANIVFSKARLLDKVWGMDAVVDDSTVAVHINRIREKIGESSSRTRYIETLWGAGYRFNRM